MAIQGYSSDNHLQKTSASGLVAIDASQSMCAWMYVPTYSGIQSYFSVIYASSAAIQFGMRDGGIKVWGWGNVLRVIGPATYTNTWFHAVWTYDGSDNRLYYNGSLVGGPTSGTQSGVPDEIFYSGYNLSASETFTGQLEDVRFYDRVISVAEMETIHSSGGRDGILSGLLGRWMFNEASLGQQVSTAVDLSQNRNDLVPVGAGGSPHIYTDSPIPGRRVVRRTR